MASSSASVRRTLPAMSHRVPCCTHDRTAPNALRPCAVSTSTERDVALGYMKQSNKTAQILFEIRMGMIDRGAVRNAASNPGDLSSGWSSSTPLPTGPVAALAVPRRERDPLRAAHRARGGGEAARRGRRHRGRAAALVQPARVRRVTALESRGRSDPRLALRSYSRAPACRCAASQWRRSSARCRRGTRRWCRT